ncbi:hypothetical protein PGT21_025033 [Puccinia graminis f. sp. tritici]|uniref:RNase H type-1 domain-containing protein n=1 Tax=Puccinia graminis f. sp. tritici TaxID=56615 RepID=A0A5B0NV97_PUCGR|nr:hypothetical protein PGT21_025033 [Puccinia graminis f. sp. tritici]
MCRPNFLATYSNLLIISVLRSRVFYGSSIWAINRKHSTIKNLFDKINNQANRIILGLFKTTPCKFLSRDSPLIPFFEVLKIKNHLYIIKKSTAPSSHPIKHLINSEISNSPSTHPSPIHNILDKHLINDYDLPLIKTIQPHISNPWEDFSLPISNLKIKKEDIKSIVQRQINNSKLNSEHHSEHLIFTDGSNSPENGASSAAILDNSFQSSCCVNNSEKASTFEAEVQAIIIGLDIFIKRHLSSTSTSVSTPPINFFVDNQATLYSISHPPLPISYQSNFINIFNKFKIIINLCHIPIHSTGAQLMLAFSRIKNLMNLPKQLL